VIFRGAKFGMTVLEEKHIVPDSTANTSAKKTQSPEPSKEV